VMRSAAVFVLAFLIFNLIRRKIAKPSSIFLLIFVVLSYAYGISKIIDPAEILHFFEYGVLGFLIFKALNLDLPDLYSYIFALVLASIFGWIDEGIQNLLPNRYYSNGDVFLNSVSSALGLVFVYIFKRENDR